MLVLAQELKVVGNSPAAGLQAVGIPARLPKYSTCRGRYHPHLAVFANAPNYVNFELDRQSDRRGQQACLGSHQHLRVDEVALQVAVVGIGEPSPDLAGIEAVVSL